MKYPFMFIVGLGTSDPKIIVKIASYDLRGYSSEWMGDEVLGKTCWVPDVDLTHENHEFKTELEALKFIKQWWANQELE